MCKESNPESEVTIYGSQTHVDRYGRPPDRDSYSDSASWSLTRCWAECVTERRLPRLGSAFVEHHRAVSTSVCTYGYVQHSPSRT